MSGALHGVIASLKGAAAAATDTFWKYVSLLLNTSATNGAQNNTFLDSSTNNFTVTRNGDTTQGSFNPYMPTGYWSGYFDGTGDYLSAPDNTAWDFGTGDFTVEAWYYPTTSNAQQIIVGQWDAVGGGSGLAWVLFTSNNSSRFLRAATSSNGSTVLFDLVSTSAIELNAWNHVAFVRSGTTFQLYLNGAAAGSGSTTSSSALANATNALTIGASSGGTQPATGYISNVRVVKGTAVYSGSTYTIPTAPLTAITNTSLLCLQDNRFKDNSANAFAITRNGDTRISKFAPFNPPASYSTTSYGGSGYFDGTGDSLTLASNAAFGLGTGDFTIEMWVYATANPANGPGSILDLRTGATATATTVRIDSSLNVLFYDGPANSAINVGTIQLNTWAHIAHARASGSVKTYINGTLSNTTAVTSDLGSNQPCMIGNSQAAGYAWNGYLSNFRIVKGTAVYTANFTPPTTPLTAITNTSLLLNFTNAGIYDAATINDGQTVGNAQVSTTQAKWGTTSMYFDGDDRLVFASRPEIAIGTGNFTIEGWIYRTDTGTRGTFQISGTAGGLQPSTSNTLGVGTAAGSVWEIYCNNTNYVSTATYSTNTWYHFALVRNSGTTRLYIDGTSVISQADTTNYTGQNLCVGAWYNTGFALLGYIDELRITNGYARYTANFTPPTAAFPTL